jgi:hypothetical protein
MKHSLKTPIKMADGSTIKDVEVSTVKVKHLRVAEAARNDGGEFAAGIALLAAVTGLSVEAVEEMDAMDFTALQEKLAGFLPQPTRAE